jgi:MoaA/NifB/PqqE/SkfB family radical SAM enzyme
MNSLPKNFCVAPFAQCTTHPSDSFSPCPYLGGTVWNNNDKSIMSQWHSNGIQQLRQDFLNNKQSPICNRCWHEEKNNKRSLRLRLFDPVNHTSDYVLFAQPDTVGRLLRKINSGDYQQGPEILTIKNGNLCNARCRVCHPGDSSRWIGDAKKIYEMTGQQYYDIGRQEINWNDSQLEEISVLSKTLQRLELFGGEPVYNKQVHKLLERIVQTGDSKHISLYINTNGSVDIVEKMPYVKEFREVEIGVSIDGVGEHFDYIRNGLEYQTVKRNVLIWKEYFERHGVRYSIDSISTVEILNIYYLPELKRAVTEILPLPPFWNLLVDPAYLFIKNMPDHVKTAVIDKLSEDAEFTDLINVIQQPADMQEWKKFLEVTQVLDSIRNENFAKTFPEFYEIISRG